MKISVQELLIVLAIVLIIFGPSQLPKLMKTMGEGLKGFKQGMSEESEKKEAATTEVPAENETKES